MSQIFCVEINVHARCEIKLCTITLIKSIYLMLHLTTSVYSIIILRGQGSSDDLSDLCHNSAANIELNCCLWAIQALIKMKLN